MLEVRFDEFVTSVCKWARATEVAEGDAPNGHLMQAIAGLGALAAAVDESRPEASAIAIGRIAVHMVSYAEMAGIEIQGAQPRDLGEEDDFAVLYRNIGAFFSPRPWQPAERLNVVLHQLERIAENRGLVFAACCSKAFDAVRMRVVPAAGKSDDDAPSRIAA